MQCHKLNAKLASESKDFKTNSPPKIDRKSTEQSIRVKLGQFFATHSLRVLDAVRV
jgi:hypothetical protein